MQIVQELLLSQGGSAFDCVAECGRFLVGVGEGKLVAMGTDVGLSDAARRLLNALAERSATRLPGGALRFIQVDDAQHVADIVEQALRSTSSGDLLFFLVPGQAELRAVKSVLQALQATR